MKGRGLSPEDRRLVDLHHRLASTSDHDYDPTTLGEIAEELRQVRAAPTLEAALAVVAWWTRDDELLRNFCRRARHAELPPVLR